MASKKECLRRESRTIAETAYGKRPSGHNLRALLIIFYRRVLTERHINVSGFDADTSIGKWGSVYAANDETYVKMIAFSGCVYLVSTTGNLITSLHADYLL